MRDDRLGAAIVQHIGDLLGFAVPVDRHAVGAKPLCGIARLEECKVVAQHHAYRIARTDAKLAEPGRRAGGALHQRIARYLPRAADHAAECDLRHHPSS